MDTTTTQTDSQIEADLLNLAGMADRGESLPENTTAGNQGADAELEKQSTTQGDDKTQAQTGTAQASTPPEGEAKPKTEQKRESEYARFQKDKKRLGENWQVLQAEKQQLAAERAAFLREREELQKLRNGSNVVISQNPQAAPGGHPTLAKYSDRDLDEAIETFEADGRTDLVRAVRAEIAARRQAIAQQQTRAQELPQQPSMPAGMSQEQFLGEWNGHLKALKAEHKELEDANSPLFKTVHELIQTRPYFSQHPSRIREAVEAARTILDARAVPEMRKRLNDYEQELTTLRKATSPGKGSTESRGAAQKPFADMSDEEQVAFLRREAAAVDGG